MLSLAVALLTAGPALASPVVVMCDGEDLARVWAVEDALRDGLAASGREVRPVRDVIGAATGDPVEQIKALKQEGLNAYELLEVELARESLNNADALALRNLDTVPRDLIAEIAVARAALEWGEGDPGSASRSMRAALILSPGYEPGAPLPPAARKAMRDLTDDMAFEEPGSLALRAPTGAKIYIDGVERGTGDLVIEKLVPGPHLLLAQREGRSPSGRVVDVKPGERATVELQPPAPIEAVAAVLDGLRAGDLAPARGVAEAGEVEVLACVTGDRTLVAREGPGATIARGEVDGGGAPAEVAKAILALGAPEVAPPSEPLDLGPVLVVGGVSVGVVAVAAVVVGGVVLGVNAIEADRAATSRRQQGAAAGRRVVLGF